jgi:hypothetical protein
VGGALWGRVASELMPALRRCVSAMGARRCVLERALCHRFQRALVSWAWTWDLTLEVEVWDMLDETCLLSAEGELCSPDYPHKLRVKGADRCEVVCPAFSAASRDPVQRRFASINDYCRRQEDTVEKGIHFKVYVRDERTGRQALLWDVYHEHGLVCEDVDPVPDDPIPPFLPEGSLHVYQAEYLPIYSRALPGQALRARAGFYVCPEAVQEGVAEADKMWRVAGGDEDEYDDHSSFFYLEFEAEQAELASLVRGLIDT